MFDMNFQNRKELVNRNRELNKGFNKDIYAKGNNNKIELDKKLEALSINSGVAMSGNMARKGILSQAAQPSRSNSSVYEVSSLSDDNYNNEYFERQLSNGINRGKDIMNSINNTNKNS